MLVRVRHSGVGAYTDPCSETVLTATIGVAVVPSSSVIATCAEKVPYRAGQKNTWSSSEPPDAIANAGETGDSEFSPRERLNESASVPIIITFCTTTDEYP